MLVLASASPQRKTLLEQIGINPVVIPADIDEELEESDVNTFLKRLAEKKARATVARVNCDNSHLIAFSNLVGFWNIAADTVIILDGAILGKAPDEKTARWMLESMSGRTHHVLTGVFAGKIERGVEGDFIFQTVIADIADTEVIVKSLSSDEISRYISTDEWRGAAGAYRIQGKGACLIKGISGSFSNVVGLPIELIYGMLVQLGYVFEAG